MILLGVNIDHVATLREARGGIEPDPVEAAIIVESSGADGVTVHLREDRRHIQDKDLYRIKNSIKLPLNLEMACSQEIIDIAKDLKPHMCTLVPEKRQELTTEGGLDLLNNYDKVYRSVKELQDSGMLVSIFIEADNNQIEAASKIGVEYIELHTGSYANSKGNEKEKELSIISNGAKLALNLGIKVNAGHGLNYNNIENILLIPEISEVNIGHSIISRSVFIGLGKAVKEMKSIITGIKY